jgi:nucleotide-binding universal stress UspA family protein
VEVTPVATPGEGVSVCGLVADERGGRPRSPDRRSSGGAKIQADRPRLYGMGKRVLLPVDGSEQAHEACEFVIAEFDDATLVLLHVINPAEAGYSAQTSIPSFSEEWYEQQRANAESLFEDIESLIAESDHDVETVVEVGKPTRTIVEYAAENNVDQIVMGSHGRSGVTRILLGSVAEAVVRRSPVPVTVVR